MRSLLRDFPEGVPLDTLLARIKGRRSYLVESWDRLLLAAQPLRELPPAPWRPPLGEAGDQVWRALQQEYTWVFRWMPEGVRLKTAPYFWLTELRTVGICLRRRSGGTGVDEELLAGSLLGEPIRRALAVSSSASEAVRQLGEILTPRAPACADLGEIFREGGSGAVERRLEDIFLEQLAASRLHPVLWRTVTMLIDGANLTAVAKRLRWSLTERPRLLAGGSISPGQLEQIFARRDMAALARLGASLAGPGRVGGGEEVEQTVLQAQYRLVRTMAREPSGVGAIVDYLWRCRNEARSIGLLSRLAMAGAEAVDGEIVP